MLHKAVDKHQEDKYAQSLSTFLWYTHRFFLHSILSKDHQTAKMTAHTELTSQEDFQKALATKDKYVFIYAYEGEISPQAEEYVQLHLNSVQMMLTDL